MQSDIKLTIDPANAGRVQKLPALWTHAVSKPQEEQHVDRYFDTTGLDLRKHGMSLRVRSTGQRHVQTLTADANGPSGPRRRTELETEIDSETPDQDLFLKQVRKAAPGLAHRLDRSQLAPEPVFVNHATRTGWTLALPDGTHVECALDTGELQRDDRTARVHELELELKDGDPARLYELALRVHEAIPVHIESASEAERGYALMAEDKIRAVKAAPLTLKRKASLGDAFGEILRNCLQQMQANERGALAGDVDSLHQMRVGLRRLRAALALVRNLMQLPEPLVSDIEWLAGEVGQAHDWDVFLETVLPGLPLLEEQRPSLEHIAVAARAEAERQRARVRAAIVAPRYTTLMLALGSWISGKRWQHTPLPPDPLAQKIGKAAPRLVQHAATRVRKRARSDDLERPASLDKVRIAAKRERYAREFFDGLSHTRKARRRHHLLVSLQHELGGINDTFVARELVAELAEQVPHEGGLLDFIEGVLAERALDVMPRARRHVKARLCDKAAF